LSQLQELAHHLYLIWKKIWSITFSELQVLSFSWKFKDLQYHKLPAKGQLFDSQQYKIHSLVIHEDLKPISHLCSKIIQPYLLLLNLCNKLKGCNDIPFLNKFPLAFLIFLIYSFSWLNYKETKIEIMKRQN
jgi:hypothetical protein